MVCPKCGSEKVNVQREQTATIGGAHTFGKKSHGIMYFLFIGWWIWIFKICFFPILILWRMLFGKRGKGLNTVTAQKVLNRTVAVCQDCGNSWKV